MPKTDDGWMRFVAITDDLELWFKETVNRGDDNMEGEDDKIIFLGPPLEVMFCSYLYGRGIRWVCNKQDGIIDWT